MVSPRLSLSIPRGSTPSTALLRRRTSHATRALSTTTASTSRPTTQKPTSTRFTQGQRVPGVIARSYTPRLPASRGFHSTPRALKKTTVHTFNLADIGEGITECEIIKWSVTPGSPIQSFDPLCEVQSDKASVEITSPFDGIVKEILVPEGEIAKVGSGLCLIEVEVEEGAEVTEGGRAAPEPEPETKTTTSPPPSSTSAAESKPQRKHHPLDPSNPNPSLSLGSRPRSRTGAPPFSGGSASIRSKDLLNLDFNAQDQALMSSSPSHSTSTSTSTGSGTTTPGFATTSDANVLATPQVRHFAKTLGVMDLSALAPGSGREGRIEREDVERFVERQRQSIAAQQQQQQRGPGDEVTSAFASGGVRKDEDVVVELNRTRWNMWRAMEKSLEIPHFGYSTTLDITSLHTQILPILNANIPARYLPSSHPRPRDPLAGMVNPRALFSQEEDVRTQAEAEVPESARFAKMTYLPFLLKTLGMAMMEWPLMRSSITPGSWSGNGNGGQGGGKQKPTLTIRSSPQISLALSTPTGLYTPTLNLTSSPHTLSLYSIASQLKHLSYLGRQVPCGLTPKEMPRAGGTVTVSNVGAVGRGEGASPVLVPGGGVAIVAVGRARWVWDVEDPFWSRHSGDEGFGSMEPPPGGNGGKSGGSGGMRGQRRLKLPVSWSADHRVVEGAELAAFVETWRKWVEEPVRLIGGEGD
ncbi:hypothetical protein CC1G_12062 [Coprinopsis cinerea okayama7|uniref:Dihydrolipoamide acetyltransferase component of pyruvate dehydrogenase complex n=1 Tax=Coprinopsis cinerea (strain Okayama-7 / 130 / ATCC MYA-4618 / FGSC 9003) TaxID=240176 RepID=A8N0D1_COPC7|nr:hypothetical protein CC1G_12062 [Coprinopsis cinerea okayama7\|eukprot:XP_001828332.1 hypothetical protein CC1G_12062 [Coprinopsis cinerea okayama7\